MPTRWKRPDSVPFPSVWRRCQGKRPMPDGTIPRFRIQDLTDDIAEEVIDHMCSIFLRDEIMCSTAKLADDPVSLKEIRDLWHEVVKQRVALVAFVDNDDQPPRLAGANMTGISYKDDPKDKYKTFRGEKLRQVFKALEDVSHMVDVYKKYDVDEYMTALGLSVVREFRGQGLGLELLKARYDIGRAVGLKLTVTLFTGNESQVQARRAGFELLKQMPYSEYEQDGKTLFANDKVENMELMAARIQ